MSSNQLLEDELTAFCRSHALSKDGLRAIFEGHGVAPNDNDSNMSYDFFHEACCNEKVTDGILRNLLEYFPNAVRFADGYIDDGEEKIGGCTPLHSICFNKNVTLCMVQLLIDAYPESVSHENNKACMPLHYLCSNEKLNDEVGLEILKLLLERFPESVRHAARDGVLPIHFAAAYQSPEFCRILIQAYPGSEQMVADGSGMLPFHLACASNTVATAEYLYQLYPESINVANNYGSHPIHYAVRGLKDRSNPEDVIEVMRFLLDCDPNVVLQKFYGKLPLYWVCNEATNDNTQQRLNAHLKVLRILYDAHPEAIESNEVTSDIHSFCEEVQSYINAQLTYARQARDLRQMNTPDENGQLPLHKALRDHETITLGSIKLLVKGNPSAIREIDNRGMMPLHIACQYRVSPAVVEYLINLNEVTLGAVDEEGNAALHYACCGANHAIIALLLDRYGSISVSKRNAHKQLPIDLLLQSKNEASDKESVEYTESIYRLIRAYPEALMRYDLGQTGSEDCQNRNKRKIDEV